MALQAALSRAVIARCASSCCYFEKDLYADASKIEIFEMGVLAGSQISLDSGHSNAGSRNRVHFCSSERPFLLATWDGRRALVVLLRLGLFDPRT